MRGFVKKLSWLFIFLVFLSFSTNHIGDEIDDFQGVAVFYNGAVKNVHGRNISSDGYNLGLKWQCVEYVKRFYYEIFDHKFPNSYGHAIDFFDPTIPNGAFNDKRGLYQFKKIPGEIPKAGDILIFNSDRKNPFGHVAIVTEVGVDGLQYIQQNVGRHSRGSVSIIMISGKTIPDDDQLLGWLSISP